MLKNHADFLAFFAKFLLAQGKKIFSLYGDAARSRTTQKVDCTHQSRLSRTGKAYDSKNVAFFHGDASVFNGIESLTVLNKGLGYVF